jgi:hypothetical protein
MQSSARVVYSMTTAIVHDPSSCSCTLWTVRQMLLLFVLCSLPLAPLTSALTAQSAAGSRDQIKWTHLGNLSPYHRAPAVQGVLYSQPTHADYYFKLKSSNSLTRSANLDRPAWQSIPISHGVALHPTIDLQAQKSIQCDPKG